MWCPLWMDQAHGTWWQVLRRESGQRRSFERVERTDDTRLQRRCWSAGARCTERTSTYRRDSPSRLRRRMRVSTAQRRVKQRRRTDPRSHLDRRLPAQARQRLLALVPREGEDARHPDNHVGCDPDRELSDSRIRDHVPPSVLLVEGAVVRDPAVAFTLELAAAYSPRRESGDGDEAERECDRPVVHPLNVPGRDQRLRLLSPAV